MAQRHCPFGSNFAKKAPPLLADHPTTDGPQSKGEEVEPRTTALEALSTAIAMTVSELGQVSTPASTKLVMPASA